MKLFVQEKKQPIKVPHSDPGSTQVLITQLTDYFKQIPAKQEIVFVCVGTDRSTGDALGPFVGARLKKYNFSDIHVYGTLDNPVHALNLQETLDRVENEFYQPFMVGIDACLGQISSVGQIQLCQGPLKPGAGVNKELPPVGQIHMTGIVNVGGFMEYFVLQNTRLSLVVNMAEVIAKSIYISLIHSKRIGVFSTNSILKRFD